MTYINFYISSESHNKGI